MLNSDRITTRMWDPLSLGEVQDACRIDRDGVLRPLYVEQARYKIYRMSIFRPPPAFVIYLKHLPHRIKEELANLDRQTKDYVIKEAIGRIFEHVDRRFYYISAKPILEWRLE